MHWRRQRRRQTRQQQTASKVHGSCAPLLHMFEWREARRMRAICGSCASCTLSPSVNTHDERENHCRVGKHNRLTKTDVVRFVVPLCVASRAAFSVIGLCSLLTSSSEKGSNCEQRAAATAARNKECNWLQKTARSCVLNQQQSCSPEPENGSSSSSTLTGIPWRRERSIHRSQRRRGCS